MCAGPSENAENKLNVMLGDKMAVRRRSGGEESEVRGKKKVALILIMALPSEIAFLEL